MRYRGSVERPLSITPNSHDEPLDKDFLHRFSSEIPLHEATKICLRNQQVIGREALFPLLAASCSLLDRRLKCLNCQVYTAKKLDNYDDEFGREFD